MMDRVRGPSWIVTLLEVFSVVNLHRLSSVPTAAKRQCGLTGPPPGGRGRSACGNPGEVGSVCLD
jgi:hypothetical protein